MDDIVKVHILGFDEKLLKNVSERVNESRPAKVTYFTDLKDFLEKSIEDKPDLVGLSVGFPHKSVAQFPKIFRMALNVPVLAFGENQDLRTRKALSGTKSDLKISGVITAHNLWMKIINLRKIQEDEIKKLNQSKDEKEKQKLKDSVFLKGGAEDKYKNSKSNVLNDLYKALDNPEAASKELNMNVVKSGDATKYKKTGVNHINTSDTRGLGDDSESSSNEGGDSRKDSDQTNQPRDGSNIAYPGGADSKSANLKGKGNSLGGLSSAEADDNNSSMNHVGGKFDASADSLKNKNDSYDQALNSHSNQSNGDSNSALGSKKSKSTNSGSPTSDEGNNSMGKEGLSAKKRTKPQSQSDEKLKNRGDGDNAKKRRDQKSAASNNETSKDSKKSKDPNEPNQADKMSKKDSNRNGTDADSNEAKKPKEKSSTKPKDPTSPESTDKPNKAKKDQEEGDFGAIKVADAEQVKKEADQKAKAQESQENDKKVNILKTCCKKALEGSLNAYEAEEARAYDVEKIKVFTIDMGTYKGCLLISNSFKQEFVPDEITDFRTVLIQSLQGENLFADVSLQYSMDISVENYLEVVEQFSDFNITHEDSSGKLLNVAFVEREVIVPTLSDSDKKDMYLVDIKVIPPETPVNFDAFIYLPRNKRFVRYLKTGCSLSLKQAKRHTEEDGPSQLYLPRNQKIKFIEFFIRNTLNWEFALHSHKEKKAA